MKNKVIIGSIIAGMAAGVVAGVAGHRAEKEIRKRDTERKYSINPSKRRILVLSNVASMIVQFNMRNLRILKELEFEVEVACNFMVGNTCTEDVLDELKISLNEMGIPYHQIDFARGNSDVVGQLCSFRQIDTLFKERGYDVIFVQSTIAGIAARLFGKRYGCKIIYIAHGFQFYEGAAKSRWILFHTIEKLLAKWTDTLILTNEDDYKLARRDFNTSDIRFVPGVGVEIESFELDESFNKNKEREKRGIKPDDYVIFSAGELSERKNHRIVMEIIRDMNNPRVKYLICGIGPLEEEYKSLISSWGMEDRIILLGYQKDLKSIYGISDLFILPSLNEGLPVCLLMSIASKVVSACSDIRGNHELVRDKHYLFPPTDKEAIKYVIDYAMKCDSTEITTKNYINLQKYGSNNVDKMMMEVFTEYR